jgi:hypothetical protein
VSDQPAHTVDAEIGTALVVVGRVHTGRGTSPYRLAQEADILAAYLRTGAVVEDPLIAESMERFAKAAESVLGATVMLPGVQVTYTPPRAEDVLDAAGGWSIWPWRRRRQQREIDERRAWRSFAAGHEQEHR